MKKVKNSLYLTSIFLLIILFGYFFHSFNQFNSNIKEDNFINSIYESKDEENYIDFAKTMEEAGADFITLHARTRSAMYEGHADWEKIALLKKELNIPVFANGDIKSLEDAKKCLKITKCDGISIGRGIMGDFTLPYRIEKYLEEQIEIKEPNLKQKIEMLKEHLLLEIENLGETNGIKFMRKFYNYYISSVKNASKYRSMLVRLENEKEILKVLDEILCIHNSNC